MAQQLIVTLVVILTGMTAISILFGLLLLTSLALNALFPNTQAGNKTENENAMPPHIPPQVDEETIAVIQAAIATHLRRPAQ
jgi:Na+-transporting methylmalonyl-CoA/oxaloacetate decarboxylase gamma subunit